MQDQDHTNDHKPAYFTYVVCLIAIAIAFFLALNADPKNGAPAPSPRAFAALSTPPTTMDLRACVDMVDSQRGPLPDDCDAYEAELLLVRDGWYERHIGDDDQPVALDLSPLKETMCQEILRDVPAHNCG